MKKILLTLSMLFASVAIAQEVEMVEQDLMTQEAAPTAQKEETAPVIIEEEMDAIEEMPSEDIQEVELDQMTEQDAKE
ncbi:MAG: hypothetical protein ACD_82C00195G0005 [uncultured bacterium]|jgi:hypothetical protein|nr:MAG: hypothetical protein ACD_82C00195G0005 [uncultured bacterium]KKP28185.1 MAG: hypothetical protein UR12_C0023G0006 [candidate division TM6 bacterium GW2011_GWF2_30_66]